MKLRNKKTGEIHEITQAVFLSDDMNKKFAIYSKSEGHNYAYRNLAELNAEWEDYEEPKESEYYWYIGYKNDIRRTKYHHTSDFADNQVTETRKEIGNCFESLEEAEKAVEKLKAWKRLKDNGWYFKKWQREKLHISIELRVKEYDFLTKDVVKDLDLLFGGEE